MESLKEFVNKVGKNNLIAIVVIVLLLILGFFLLSGKSSNLFQKKPTSTAVPTATPRPTTVPGETIMLTLIKAVPNTLTLKKGHLVNFVNFSGSRVDIEGVDSSSKELNIGILEDNGTSDEILLKNTGTYKYYDKLKPKIAGEIVVTN
jgi:plastocyanin